jgi:superfamily I DNA/RNA helicase
MLNSPEKPKPTDEQVQIMDRLSQTDDNILVNALAGSGKTTTIEMMINSLPDSQPCLYLAFNKSIVKEAEERMPSYCKVQTLNSLGHRVWGQATGKKLSIDLKNPKTHVIVRQLITELHRDDKDEAWDRYSEICKAINMAKHLGYIPAGKFPTARPLTDRQGLEGRLEDKFSDFCWSLIDNALCISIKAAYDGGIDFDDQIYMPTLFGGSFPRFPTVFIDEDQDLSPVNHAMLHKMRQSRMVAVGDRWQAIYGFRGAETNGVDKIKHDFNMVELPLSYSFRCPENIVRAVHWHVPHMRWVKTGGVYAQLQDLDPGSIPDGSTFVCRNNAPLFRAAFALLSQKRSVSVAGSDIGPRIIKLLKKIGAPDDKSEDLVFKIEAWREEQLQRTNAPATVEDTAECLKIFATWGATRDQAISYANWIMAQHGTIHLTTGHKAKGREWENVYHLDKGLLKPEGQDFNLKYVITTRSASNLYEVGTEAMKWQ